MEKSILEIKAGRSYTIQWVAEPLWAMGVRPGASLRVVRLAPLGDPIQLAIDGFSLSLRRTELDRFLQLEAVDD